MPDYQRFSTDLAALCKQHHVSLMPTIDGRTGVWDGVRPSAELVNCLTTAVAVQPIPAYFRSIAEAHAHPGTCRKPEVGFPTKFDAEKFAKLLKPVEVVGVGASGTEQRWVIVRTDGAWWNEA